MKFPRNIGTFDRLVRLALGAFLVLAAFALFRHPVARLLAFALGLLELAEAAVASCPLFVALGAKDAKEGVSEKSLLLVAALGTQLAIAYEWWSAGFEKVSGPGFVQGIGGTLARFASENPFPWYKQFLLGFATDNAAAFAYAVEWSQVGVALALAVSAAAYAFCRRASVRRGALAVSAAALFGGMLMNANFYLAAGWTGPGSHGLNVVMFWVQAFLAYAWVSLLLKRTSP